MDIKLGGQEVQNKKGPALHERIIFSIHNDVQYQLTYTPQKEQTAEELGQSLIMYNRYGTYDLSENVQSLEISGVHLPG